MGARLKIKHTHTTTHTVDVKEAVTKVLTV